MTTTELLEVPITTGRSNILAARVLRWSMLLSLPGQVCLAIWQGRD